MHEAACGASNRDDDMDEDTQRAGTEGAARNRVSDVKDEAGQEKGSTGSGEGLDTQATEDLQGRDEGDIELGDAQGADSRTTEIKEAQSTGQRLWELDGGNDIQTTQDFQPALAVGLLCSYAVICLPGLANAAREVW